MTRERLAWLLALLCLVIGGWWLSANTEWVDEKSPRPAKGEARDNPVYAAEQLLRRLGMKVERHEALRAMPPPRARLVLLSSDWQLMPERAEQLHQWVLGGGHLVLARGRDSGWDDTAMADWVPVDSIAMKAREEDEDSEERPVRRSRAAAAAPVLQPPKALLSSPPLWDGLAKIETCHWFYRFEKLRVKQGHSAAWSLAHKERTQALRVPLGQGSVTVLNSTPHLFENPTALACDNPLLLAAALQAESGATAWIYLSEKREALLPWLWHQGWIAIAAGLLTLAAALWRAAVRFGPLMAAAPRLRRSLTEQVRGLAAYLHKAGPEALLAAQQRALVETAARSLPRFARLTLSERAAAIAALTGLAPLELSTALSTRFCSRAQLPQLLLLLETARRRLLRHKEERPLK